jgi:helicase
MAEHFIGVERLLEILRLVKTQNDPIEILAELECSGYEQEKREREKKGRR